MTSSVDMPNPNRIYNEEQFKSLLLDSLLISVKMWKDLSNLKTKGGRKRFILFTMTDYLEVAFPINNVNINFSDSPDNLNRIADELSEYTYDELYTFAYL